MITALVWTAYVASFVFAWRLVYCVVWDEERRERQRFLHYEPNRVAPIVIGACAGIAGPLVLIVIGIWKAVGWFITAPTPTERRELKEQQMKDELAELRRLARKHNLPLPEEVTR